ncbi:hypothetical protein ACWCQ0_15300 [Streptomyces massasporeus]|uniref:Uncharacterized protein n=1 Tax=Streptomyces massasporeus TaxID=67324 RepID=A0ABW6LL89_9ACTN
MTDLPVPHKVSRVRRETADTVSLTLTPAGDEALGPFTPGQFAMVYAFGVGEIPVSVSRIGSGSWSTRSVRWARYRPRCARSGRASRSAWLPAGRRAEGTVTDACPVPPTAQNQGAIEDDLVRTVEQVLAEGDPSDEELTHLCERAIRNHDPCISCSTHFLDLTIDRA